MLIRKSMLEDYIRCPYAFKLKHIDDLNPEYESKYASLGTWFHEFAFSFFDYFSYIDSEVKEEILSNLKGLQYDWADFFLQFELRRWSELESEFRLREWKPLYRELTLHSTELGITGTIDRIDWFNRKENSLILIEYKTTQILDRTSLRRQLHFYKLLYEHADENVVDADIVAIACINPRIKRVWKEPVKKRSENNVLKWLKKIRSSICSDSFPFNDSYCIWCDVAEYCPLLEV
ncbi:MAG: RecB family exonuclease [Candidatus Thorarchaeota archaeon]